MNEKEELPRELVDQIVQWLPPVQSLRKCLLDRSIVGFFLPEDAQHLHLAAVCLRDLADTMQTAGEAIYRAKYEWLRWTMNGDKRDLPVAVHQSRFYFDYAAISLSAASNHLASSMWHLAERVDCPLGRNYKTAASVRNAWSIRRPTSAPACFAILDSLIEDSTWKTLSQYRDKWVHRGLPIIAGEYREARRKIWQNASDPPPATPYLMERETAEGRACYMVQFDEPESSMSSLLDQGAGALSSLVTATKSFMAEFDGAFEPYRISFADMPSDL